MMMGGDASASDAVSVVTEVTTTFTPHLTPTRKTVGGGTDTSSATGGAGASSSHTAAPIDDDDRSIASAVSNTSSVADDDESRLGGMSGPALEGAAATTTAVPAVSAPSKPSKDKSAVTGLAAQRGLVKKWQPQSAYRVLGDYVYTMSQLIDKTDGLQGCHLKLQTQGPRGTVSIR